MRIPPLAAALLLLGGCTTQPATTASDTLAGNPTIDTSDVRLLYSPERWSAVENRKYDGYVVMEGVPEADSSVKIQKVVEAIPDHGRDDMAMEFGSRLKAIPETSGTYFTPKIRVYAVFYTGALGSHSALVFTYQPPSSAFTKRGESHGDAYVTAYDPASWQLADGTLSIGENLTPDHR